MTETATLDDYRDVIGKARTLVIAWRDAEAKVMPQPPNDDAGIAWFDKWRDDAIVKYNSLPQYLVTPNPDMLVTRLDELRGTSRAMSERCDWGRLAPGAEGPFDAFATTIRTLWPRFPDNGTPEATAAEPLLRAVADEFTPVEPRQP